MVRKDSRVDAYITRSPDFARPILKRLREVVHTACPEVEETLKWSMPAFMYKGILCGIAAFKEHCVFGLWKESLLRDQMAGLRRGEGEAMGQFGRIRSLSELPADKDLIRLIRAAAELNDRGIKPPSRARPKANRRLRVPGYFLVAVKKNRKALATFESFSYSNRKEYVDWVAEARREDTRRRRLETAVAWMAEGKARNWKYIRT